MSFHNYCSILSSPDPLFTPPSPTHTSVTKYSSIDFQQGTGEIPDAQGTWASGIGVSNDFEAEWTPYTMSHETNIEDESDNRYSLGLMDEQLTNNFRQNSLEIPDLNDTASSVTTSEKEDDRLRPMKRTLDWEESPDCREDCYNPDPLLALHSNKRRRESFDCHGSLGQMPSSLADPLPEPAVTSTPPFFLRQTCDMPEVSPFGFQGKSDSPQRREHFPISAGLSEHYAWRKQDHSYMSEVAFPTCCPAFDPSANLRPFMLPSRDCEKKAGGYQEYPSSVAQSQFSSPTAKRRKPEDMELFGVFATLTGAKPERCCVCNCRSENIVACTNYLVCKRSYCESCALKIESSASKIISNQLTIRENLTPKNAYANSIFYCKICQ